MTPGFVYFIEAQTKEKLIKIGKSYNVVKRFGDIQNMSGCKLKLLGFYYCENYTEAESELHRKFAEHRQYGEWFNPHENIKNFIAEQLRTITKAEVSTILDLLSKDIDHLNYRTESIKSLEDFDTYKDDKYFQKFAEEKIIDATRSANSALVRLNEITEVFYTFCHKTRWQSPGLDYLLSELRLDIRRIMDPFYFDWKEAKFKIESIELDSMCRLESFDEENDNLKKSINIFKLLREEINNEA